MCAPTSSWMSPRGCCPVNSGLRTWLVGIAGLLVSFGFTTVAPAPAPVRPTVGQAASATASLESVAAADAGRSFPNTEGSLKFAVLGDFGTGDRAQYELAERMADLRTAFPFDLVVTVGDNIYGSERPQDFERKFERPYKPLLDGGVKFYATLGNHDSREQRYYKHANKAYLDWAKEVGFIGAAEPIVFQLYLESLQKYRLAARGHGDVQPPASHRRRIETFFDPIPFWYPPFEGAVLEAGEFPMHAITQRPMHMYHSWGSQNAWLRQITAENRLYMHRDRAARLGIADEDWVWITSAIGRVRCQVRLMDGVNPDTVWTWNAIGKRTGAWNLAPDAPESTRGFLLNHLISELLPERDGGYRFSNSDPVTGQAAWYDLRVRVERAKPEEAHESWPRFERLKNPQGEVRIPVSTFGSEFREGSQ